MANEAEISKMELEIESLKATVASQSDLIAKLEALVEHYEEQFKLAKRRQFGSSSEQSPDQLRFDFMFNEAEDQADAALPEPEREEITYTRKKRVGKRKEDLDGLPVERIDYELPESERGCPKCGELMPDIGVSVRNELEIVPAKVVNVEHAVHAYACAKCDKAGEGTPVVKAEAPAPLIGGSLASPSAVAHVATQKYVSGVPIYRQEKMFAHSGVILSRQTMANWIVFCAHNYLLPIYRLLVASLLQESVAHADETKVQVLREPGRAAQAQSYEWLYRTSGDTKKPVVIFEYQETRGQVHPNKFLEDFKGYLHTDGYQSYHNLPSGIIVVGCWVHCRRYWENLYYTLAENRRGGSSAERGLVYCNLLFAFEHEFDGLAPKERRKQRLKYSKPVSDEFFEWVGSLHALPKSLLGQAVHYALAQRKYLENVYLDGRLEFSNNRAERSVRPFVQGRKQWLFSCTPGGAEASSIFYSIIETAKENGLIPYQYIKHLLEMRPSAGSDALDALLPWSGSLPDICRTPAKPQNAKPEKPKHPAGKGPLYQALIKLRERFAQKEGS